MCPWCNVVEETKGHAIFDCSRVRDLWVDSGCLEMTDWRSVGTMCDLVATWKQLKPEIQQRGAILAWCVWNERNQKMFENKTCPNAVITTRVARLVEEQGLYAACIYTQPSFAQRRSPNKWIAPPQGVVKINADASMVTDGWVGVGIVARDHTGAVLFSAVRRTRAYWPVEIAEGKAVAVAVN
ncbi:uncharacterized protein [Spinacia oleracea]|uniref:RNase H type-1 domain-containing protein n=1 Tax=Spinacia oleracea TaxID=3562 RepID=A0A9R0J1C1_SPIOL|nr:uncharacterized protein LOC110797407 [Spinacia oleracea]